MPASRTPPSGAPPGSARGSRLRRILAAAALAGSALGTLVLAALSSIPVFFGRDVGAGFASVERRLCALDRDGSADILIGGDSRAKLLLDPAVFDSLLGRRAVNVAEMVNFGGDLPTLANALRKRPEALRRGPVLIVSVSVPGHNDLDFAGLTAAGVLNWTALDHARAAWRAPAAYVRYLEDWYLPFLERHVVHALKGEEFACTEAVTLPAAQMAGLGFAPDFRVHDPGRPDPRRRTRTREDFLLDGGRDRAFVRALQWLAASPARAVVLYNAPIAPPPPGGEGPAERLEREMEARFAERVAAAVAAAGHPKVRFLDFVPDPPPDIRAEHFADNYHLNAGGAALFSRRMAAYLRDEGLIGGLDAEGPISGP